MKYCLPMALLALTFVAGCGAPADNADTKTAATPKSTDAGKTADAPKADAPKADASADDSTKVFTYAIVASEKDTKETTDTYKKDTPIIYVNFGLGGKAGKKIKGVWICDKAVDPKIPANTKIQEKTLDVVPPINSGDFSLSKPTAGWPLGEYHVDLYSDDTLAESVKFKVQ